jgi:hypothetical protein
MRKWWRVFAMQMIAGPVCHRGNDHPGACGPRLRVLATM